MDNFEMSITHLIFKKNYLIDTNGIDLTQSLMKNYVTQVWQSST